MSDDAKCIWRHVGWLLYFISFLGLFFSIFVSRIPGAGIDAFIPFIVILSIILLSCAVICSARYHSR